MSGIAKKKTMSRPFTRLIAHGYPTARLAEDLSSNFAEGTLATLTIEVLEGIATGDEIVEAHYNFVDGRLVKTAERIVTHL